MVAVESRAETLRTDRAAVPFSLMSVNSVQRLHTGWDTRVLFGISEASRREKRCAGCFYSGGSDEQQPGREIEAEWIRRPDRGTCAGCRSVGALSTAGLLPLATGGQFQWGVHPYPAWGWHEPGCTAAAPDLSTSAPRTARSSRCTAVRSTM